VKKETELFEAVYHYFEENGYDVRAEVNKCDVVCIKDNKIVIVELKLKFNTDLLIQLADRLRYTKNVYACVPKKEVNQFTKKGKNKVHLLKTLGVGLLTIKKENGEYILKEALKPELRNMDLLRKRNIKKRKALITEFNGREKLSNVGGSTRVAINTAYREFTTKIALYIAEEVKTTKELREHFDNPKISSILQKNYYGWFERVERGKYQLSEKGLSLLLDNELIEGRLTYQFPQSNYIQKDSSDK